MFVFQSIWKGFATWVSGKKVKFHKGMYQTNDSAIANHLRTKCKAVVTEVVAPKEEDVAEKATDKPAPKKPVAKQESSKNEE